MDVSDIEKKKEELKTLKEEKETKETKGEEKPTGRIADAHFAAERLEKANADRKMLLEKEEHIISELRLQGRSRAGETAPQNVEQTPQEFANSIIEKGVNLLIPK